MKDFIFELQRFTETINLTEDSDTYQNETDDVIINALGGDDYIENGNSYFNNSNVKINGGNGNDYINSHCDNITINGGADDDRIFSAGSNAKINGGDGNDEIVNWSSQEMNSLVDGGAGDDYIMSYGTNTSATLAGGSGNDTISSETGNNVSLSGGDGNDRFFLNSSLGILTINGGKGDDSVYGGEVYGGNSTPVVYQYKSGDGNDVIRGFKANDTVQICDTPAVWSTETSGKDIIIKVGEGKIILSGAASLDNINIEGLENRSWTLKGTTATYGSPSKTLITLKGVTSLNGIALRGQTVTLSEAALGTDKVTLIGEGYTLKLADSVNTPSTRNAWNINKTTATYKQTTTAGYTLSGNTITYSAKEVTDLITIKGLKSGLTVNKGSINGISLNGKTVTLSAAVLDKKEITINEGYTLKLASDVSKASTSETGWTMTDKTTAAYKNFSTTAGYTIVGNVISYSEASAEVTLAKIAGAKSVDGLAISGDTIKPAASALSDNISVSGNGYEFSFNSKYTKSTINGSDYDDIIKSAGKYITINSGKGDDTIVSSGSKTSINASGGHNYIQLAAKTSDQTVQTGSGYDSIQSEAQRALIETKGGSDYIVNTGANSSINAGDGNDSITNSGSNVTIDGGKGNDSIVGSDGKDTIIGGTGSDILTGGKGEDIFVYSLGDGNDTITDYAEEDKISIAAGEVSFDTKGNDVVLTVSKSKKKGTITIKNGKGKTITYLDAEGTEDTYPERDIDKNASGSAVSLRSNYDDDTFDVTSNAKVSGYAGKIVTIDASAVNQDINIVGNKKNNVIIGGDGDDTIEGGKGNDSLTGGKGSDVFVYNKGDDNDKILDYAEEDIISIKGDKVKKISTSKDKKDIIFTLASKKTITIVGGADKVINYEDNDGEHAHSQFVKFNDDGTGATLKSTYSKSTFNIAEFGGYAEDIVTINASAVNQGLFITGNQKNNVIVGGDGDDTIEGGKGNDNLTGGKGSDVFVYNKGDNSDKILDYAEEDMISIKGDTVKKISTSKDKKDIIFTLASKKTITIVGGADKVINYEDNDGEHAHSQFVKFNDDGTGATLKSTYSKSTFNIAEFGGYAEDIVTINASAVNQGLFITGNQKNNVIVGGDGDDTIEGGKGNDNLTGGDGADVFIYNKGDNNDKILDYAEEDMISIKGDTVSNIKASKGNLIFTLASKKAISIIGGADKVISYGDAGGEHSYAHFVKFNSDGTSAKLKSTYSKDNFNVADYDEFKNSIETIDASAVTNDLTIIANLKNNSIIGTASDDFIDGGKGSDTISGGKGNDSVFGGKGNDELYGGVGNDSLWGGEGDDTLYGGDGDDIFIYNPGEGKDTIADYAKGDVIMILSGDSYKKEAVDGDDVTFTFSSGKIVVQGAADNAIKFVDSNRRTIDTYSPS